MNDKKSFKLNIVIAQINPIVGDVAYNTKKILNVIERNPNADIIIFPRNVSRGLSINEPYLGSLDKR
ncbi:MAG: hypothetical protein ACTSRH_09560 [Promethearchaeota archaeon]